MNRKIINTKYKRKMLSLLLPAAMLACGLLAACGGKSASLEGTSIRIGSLKGPTSMGLLYMMNDENIRQSNMDYDFRMATGADELLPLMVKGDLDIALIPANVASVLYAKTEGNVCIIDVNTLGVLYMVSGDTSYQGISDLRGGKVYLTGKGTTPDYVLQHLLNKNGISLDECELEYKSEATEVAAVLAENPDAVGLLPQPFVTAACAQNDQLSVVTDMNAEWRSAEGFDMVTGVTVVRRAYLEENEEAVRAFLKEHAASVKAINDDPAGGAVYAVEAGIVAKEPIAQKAIPNCNITCMTGSDMKNAVQAYLNVLFDQSPEAVGGALPGDDFYYLQ